MWRPAGLPAPLLASVLLLGPAVALAAAPVATDDPDQGHAHIPHAAFPHAPYVSNPPTSGPHTPFTAAWGRHADPVPDEVLVHNLEHGGVVMGYRCGDCPDVADALAGLAEGYPRVVVAPNPRLPAPIVLSAWGHSLRVDTLDAPGREAIRGFLARHHGIDHHPPHDHGAPAAGAPGP